MLIFIDKFFSYPLLPFLTVSNFSPVTSGNCFFAVCSFSSYSPWFPLSFPPFCRRLSSFLPWRCQVFATDSCFRFCLGSCSDPSLTRAWSPSDPPTHPLTNASPYADHLSWNNFSMLLGWQFLSQSEPFPYHSTSWNMGGRHKPTLLSGKKVAFFPSGVVHFSPVPGSGSWLGPYNFVVRNKAERVSFRWRCLRFQNPK